MIDVEANECWPIAIAKLPNQSRQSILENNHYQDKYKTGPGLSQLTTKHTN
jgi:hypothetical protein